MKNLQDYKNEYNNLSKKKCLKEKEALEAVKKDGYALSFVKEQTEEICLEAVKQNSEALSYVNEQFFNNENEITINGKKYSKF